MMLGNALGALGYLDQARERLVEGLAMAHRLDNPFVLAHTLGAAANSLPELGEQDLAQ